MSRNPAVRGLLALAALISISCSSLCRCTPGAAPILEPSPTPSSESSALVSASVGAELSLPDGTVLRVAPGSLRQDMQGSLRRVPAGRGPDHQQEVVAVGGVYEIDLGVDRLDKPATLEIPFDPALLPAAAEPSQVFLSYYDEDLGQWVYAGGDVDTNRSMVVLEIEHASLWMPSTWNWGALVATLHNALQLGIMDLLQAGRLLTDECPQAGDYVQVDSSQARNLVQGCVDQDDAQQPALRVVNPRAFFFEIAPISGGDGYPPASLLSPGESLTFMASTSDPSPLVVQARVTQKSRSCLVTHLLIIMLPGWNHVGIQGHQVACITERLADTSHFVSAAESLLMGLAEDGADVTAGVAAAESISRFLREEDAVRRLITAADDCNFGPAPTWSVEGIREIGGALSTIVSATDYLTNYFAQNNRAQVSFVWSSSDVPSLSDTWTRPADGMVMVYVPQGEFPMGSTDAEIDAALDLCNEYSDGCDREWLEPEQPAHRVTLDGFWIDRTEVTNAQYARCVADGECEESWYADKPDYGGVASPLVGVNWTNAAAYCSWAGARLPTEAEWEYAARGPQGRTFPWGDSFDGTRLNFCDTRCEYDWRAEEYDDGYRYTAPVGSFPGGSSWCGALDMAGNAVEWVADWFGSYHSARQINPTGPSSGEHRVLRGSSWGSVLFVTHCARRSKANPEVGWPNVGVRCARGSQ